MVKNRETTPEASMRSYFIGRAAVATGCADGTVLRSVFILDIDMETINLLAYGERQIHINKPKLNQVL